MKATPNKVVYGIIWFSIIQTVLLFFGGTQLFQETVYNFLLLNFTSQIKATLLTT